MKEQYAAHISAWENFKSARTTHFHIRMESEHELALWRTRQG